MLDDGQDEWSPPPPTQATPTTQVNTTVAPRTLHHDSEPGENANASDDRKPLDLHGDDENDDDGGLKGPEDTTPTLAEAPKLG